MRRVLDAIALCFVVVPLLSFAPVPKQACSEQLARQSGGPYLRQVVTDRRGVPFGEVAAWSCTGDSQAAIAEFQQRLRTMQAEADRRHP